MDEIKNADEKPRENKPDDKTPERKSPRDWAQELGHGPKKHPKRTFTGHAVKSMSRPMGSFAYEVAAVLHGWREHEHHAGEPMLLTRQEFEAALKAAMPEDQLDEKGAVVKLGGNPKPHLPALSDRIPRHPKHPDFKKSSGKEASS